MSAASTTIAARKLPMIARGKGAYVYDAEGKRYIDGSGGPAASGSGELTSFFRL